MSTGATDSVPGLAEDLTASAAHGGEAIEHEVTEDAEHSAQSRSSHFESTGGHGPMITVEDIDDGQEQPDSHAVSFSDEHLERTIDDASDVDLPDTSESSSAYANTGIEHENDGAQPDHPPRGTPQIDQNATNGTIPENGVARPRSDSRSTVASRAAPVSSLVFVKNALESIGASKEARKMKELESAVQAALANITNQETPPDPELIFRPLQIATKSYNVQLQVTALDCIGKLISYSYFAFPVSKTNQPESPDTPPLIERAIEAICDCFENEATAIEIQQQIIKSLLAAVLDDKIVVHGAGLLKAVRQIYNIFIYSKSSQNQQIAQGSLTQMIATVFDRVRTRLDTKDFRKKSNGLKSDDALSPDGESFDEDTLNEVNESLENSDRQSLEAVASAKKTPQEKLTLQSFETTKTLDDAVVADSAPTTVTRARRGKKSSRTNSVATSGFAPSDDRDDSDLTAEDEDEVYLKDAFLVFRSLCKLSQKQLSHEQQQDLRSQNMRSKLLSLHLIHHILLNYTIVFTSPQSVLKSGAGDEATQFMQIAKPHLCLSLSRNASSSVQRVYDVCCEIFWVCLKNIRVAMKKELEVFLKEVYLAVLDKKNAPVFQKQKFMDVLERLSADARALVEVYLNYDCDRTALDNMYQEIIEHLARICSAPVTITAAQEAQYQEYQAKDKSNPDWQNAGALLPSLSMSNLTQPAPPIPTAPMEYAMKQQSLRCLVEILSSLDNWSSQIGPDAANSSQDAGSRVSINDSRDSVDGAGTVPISPRIPSGPQESGRSTPAIDDDPNEIERVKQRKTALNDAIRLFNFKPKRGVKALINQGFIRTDSADDVARFLLNNERLDKAMLGEYLGEGDDFNVAVMHAFVDLMDFTKRRFVDALRQFLQSFRLPGEAQKIDRFMLKFAERYLTGNPNAFANADTAYVLAYSVIMLNTDQHSSKLKGGRMTIADFIKNNRGINDGQDLPDEYLTGIFEEIGSHEIVLNSEREHAADLGITAGVPNTGLATRAGQALANVGRDLQREKYAQASEEMANKTEQLYRSLIRAQKRSAVREALSRFIPASSIKHVGSMFSVSWMSFLSALSSQMQTAQSFELTQQCLDGIRLAVRIACRFDLETPRVAFVTALSKFTNLGNLKEMGSKNLQALKVLLEVALNEGDLLKESWREILMCISQLDRLQLLSTGIDEGTVPDVTKVSQSHLANPRDPRKSAQGKRPRPRTTQTFRQEVADETKSTDMVRSIDRIFTNTARLSSEGIIDFIRALGEVSWQEIQSSGNSDSPRTYSLQKLVEISYYNMTRVRIEWSRIWEVLGDHFNQVGCHNNTAVVFFALDSLRQLSMRFMELEELPGFKFQKDFLKPFEHVMSNSTVVSVKDMVLRCLIQMIQARGDNIRSGWKTMFGVFTVAAAEQYEAIVNIAFDYTTQIYNTRFAVVITQGAFPDLIVCLTQFSKNLRFQKKSLQAIEQLKSTVPKMLRTPECPLSRRHSRLAAGQGEGVIAGVRQPSSQTEEEQFWYPVLLAYQDVLMTGEDLEVRSRALTYLFETLIRYGGDFPIEFWDVLWRQVLYPIFIVLQSKSEMSRAPNHEELSVWLSTTMIQALRNMITLFTHYFNSLQQMLDRFLDLLNLCICQENDTIARIGSNCLQQLILQNVAKFTPEHWSKIVGAFEQLFNKTTAYDLFSAAATMSDPRPVQNETSDGLSMDAAQPQTTQIPSNGVSAASVISDTQSLSNDSSAADPAVAPRMPVQMLEDYRPQPDLTTTAPSVTPVVTAARRRFFNRIITNCVLQLLIIETVAELFQNDSVYAQIPSNELLRLMTMLKKSYQFAKKFNGDKELRMALWRQGFMRQPPNLLKQESGSANTYVSILLRMYHDEGEERRGARSETEGALIPLCADILRSFLYLDEETQQRNILAWRPVVIDVLEGYTNFPHDSFESHLITFYPLAVGLLERDLNSPELRGAVWAFFRRVGECRFGMTELPVTPGLSYGQGYGFGARGREGSTMSAVSDSAERNLHRPSVAGIGGKSKEHLLSPNSPENGSGNARPERRLSRVGIK